MGETLPIEGIKGMIARYFLLIGEYKLVISGRQELFCAEKLFQVFLKITIANAIFPSRVLATNEAI